MFLLLNLIKVDFEKRKKNFEVAWETSLKKRYISELTRHQQWKLCNNYAHTKWDFLIAAASSCFAISINYRAHHFKIQSAHEESDTDKTNPLESHSTANHQRFMRCPTECLLFFVA